VPHWKEVQQVESGTHRQTSDGSPADQRLRTFLRKSDVERLDKEAARRVAVGEDIGPDGKKINMNRSVIIRDLIEKHLP